jgi:hypothetical protein
MKLILTTTFACLLLMMGCKKDKLPIPPPGDAGLRIENATPWVFTECTVDLPSLTANVPDPPPHNYGQVNIDAKTDYKTFPAVFHYAFIRVVMNNKTYIFQPYDYNGETPLSGGRYTYKLTYSASNDRLNLQFIID